MGEYGTIQTGFWTHRKIKDLPDQAKLLAAYLLTCRHKNGLGCFYLPYGYIIADLGWTERKVIDTVSILYRYSFAMVCEVTEYIFLPDWLEWNTIKNPKHAKAILARLDEIPKQFSFFNELFDSMKRFGKHYPYDIDTVSKRYRYNVPKPKPNNSTPPPTPPSQGGDVCTPSPTPLPEYKKLPMEGGKPIYPEPFEAFWSLHPHVSPKETYERWRKIILERANGSGLDPPIDLLKLALEAYLKDCRVQDRKVQNLETFLGPKKETWRAWWGKKPADVLDPGKLKFEGETPYDGF